MEETIQQQQQQPAATGSHKVPAGLRPLLEAFARETLRAQPTDLIQFGRHFFDTLVQQRESEWVLGPLFYYQSTTQK
jgi:hypothetical protein